MRLQCSKCNVVNLLEEDDIGQSIVCGNCGQVNQAPDNPVAPWVVFHDFVIRKILRRGSEGVEVYAHQLSLDRPAVLKILSPELSQNADYVNLLLKRARLAGRLNHPNLVALYLVSKENGLYFVARENTELQTLRDLLSRQGRLDVNTAVAIYQQIADALDYAWRAGRLMHGNLKPAYLTVSDYGIAKLAEIGIAQLDLGNEPEKIKGTPQYICPEQILGETTDHRSDIYSLGANLFQSLTGAYPYNADTTIEIFQQHLHAPLRSPRELDPTIPESVCQVIAKMLAKSPGDRYPDAGVLSQDLMLIAQGGEPQFARQYPSPLYLATRAGGSPGVTLVGDDSAAMADSLAKAPEPESEELDDAAEAEAEEQSENDVETPVAASGPTSDAAHKASKLRLGGGARQKLIGKKLKPFIRKTHPPADQAEAE